MQRNAHELPQHLVLALDHHRQLIEDAHRRRLTKMTRQRAVERPLRWRLRLYVGDLLIRFGQRLRSGAAEGATDIAWG